MFITKFHSSSVIFKSSEKPGDCRPQFCVPKPLVVFSVVRQSACRYHQTFRRGRGIRKFRLLPARSRYNSNECKWMKRPSVCLRSRFLPRQCRAVAESTRTIAFKGGSVMSRRGVIVALTLLILAQGTGGSAQAQEDRILDVQGGQIRPQDL